MTRWLDKLNLRPQERKLVIFVAVVVFVALNWFFVKPYFGELGRIQQRMRDADNNIAKFNEEIQKRSFYEKQKAQLAQQGAQVSTEEMATALTREVENQARAAGMAFQNVTLAPRAASVKTNSFFEEQAANLTFSGTGESELVNFLHSLASQKTLIRIKSMGLRPDQPGRMKLGGTITLVESFQKKQAVKPAGVAGKPAPATTSTSTKPAATTAAPPKATSVPPAQTIKTTNLPTKPTPPATLPKTNALPKKSGPDTATKTK